MNANPESRLSNRHEIQVTFTTGRGREEVEIDGENRTKGRDGLCKMLDRWQDKYIFVYKSILFPTKSISKLPIHLMFKFLRVRWGLSHRNSVMNGAEEQETTAYTDQRDGHLHS